MTHHLKLILFKPITNRHFVPSFSTTASPRVTTKQLYINLLKGCKSMHHLKQIQTHIFKTGLEQNKDILNKILVFCTDPLLGSLRYAERTFLYVENPSLFSYNLIIKAFVKDRKFRKILPLFDQLRVQGLWADNFTYPFVFKAIARLGDVLLGEKIHGFVIKCGIEYDCYVCNSMMDMFAEFGCIYIVEKLFDEMPEKDSVSWNVLISGYVRCGRFKDAIYVFQRMKYENSLKPDEATIVSTLSACTALKKLDLGRDIHSYVANEFGYTDIISNALLDMYSKCGCLDIARKIFDAMPVKNLICWTSMVCGYTNSGELDEARFLFERSPSRDIVLWTAMINGYVQFNRVEEAVDLFREMQIRRVKPDIYTIVALLSGCAQLGALEQGKWIHEYIRENNLRIDAIVGTALIDMYAKCGCIERSLEIFRELKEKDTALWTSIIYGLATNGKTREALDLFSEMKLTGFRPDDITFISVLTACSHGGFVKEGRKCFNSMNMYQIEPKLEHYGCFIDLLGRSGQLDEAEKLIEEVPDKKNEILIPLYGTLLSACRTYGYFEMGERLVRRLVDLEYRDSGAYTLMANMYASVERWEDVTRVRDRMKSLGVKKSPGCSSIEIDGIVYEFLVGDMSHPEMNKVHLMLDRIAKPMSNTEEMDLEHDTRKYVSKGTFWIPNTGSIGCLPVVNMWQKNIYSPGKAVVNILFHIITLDQEISSPTSNTIFGKEKTETSSCNSCEIGSSSTQPHETLQSTIGSHLHPAGIELHSCLSNTFRSYGCTNKGIIIEDLTAQDAPCRRNQQKMLRTCDRDKSQISFYSSFDIGSPSTISDGVVQLKKHSTQPVPGIISFHLPGSRAILTGEIPSHILITIACHNRDRCWSSNPDERFSRPYSKFPNLVVLYVSFSQVEANEVLPYQHQLRDKYV